MAAVKKAGPEDTREAHRLSALLTCSGVREVNTAGRRYRPHVGGWMTRNIKDFDHAFVEARYTSPKPLTQGGGGNAAASWKPMCPAEADVHRQRLFVQGSEAHMRSSS